MHAERDAEFEPFDDEFVAELERRRDEMLRGESIVDDWRAAIAEIRDSLAARGDSGAPAS
jgi:hypothetical protein